MIFDGVCVLELTPERGHACSRSQSVTARAKTRYSNNVADVAIFYVELGLQLPDAG